MDNEIISIQSEGRKSFDLAFQIFFEGKRLFKATHYAEVPGKGFVLFWSQDTVLAKGSQIVASKLPYSMAWKAASDLAWGWLSERKDEEYTDWCDHDGSDGHGFKVYNEAWGRVADSNYGILAVLPVWAWYGK